MFQAADGSSINLVIYENDGSLASDVKQEDLVSLLEESMQQMGLEVEVLNPVFETGKLGDVCPYYRIDYTVVLNDVVMGQTMMGINADRAYTFTFTDMTGDWGQFFVDAIASITPVAASSTVTTQEESADAEEMVWISESGEKYHSTSECSNMKNPWQVSESEALAQGRTPCNKCW